MKYKHAAWTAFKSSIGVAIAFMVGVFISLLLHRDSLGVEDVVIFGLIPFTINFVFRFRKIINSQQDS